MEKGELLESLWLGRLFALQPLLRLNVAILSSPSKPDSAVGGGQSQPTAPAAQAAREGPPQDVHKQLEEALAVIAQLRQQIKDAKEVVGCGAYKSELGAREIELKEERGKVSWLSRRRGGLDKMGADAICGRSVVWKRSWRRTTACEGRAQRELGTRRALYRRSFFLLASVGAPPDQLCRDLPHHDDLIGELRCVRGHLLSRTKEVSVLKAAAVFKDQRCAGSAPLSDPS